MPVCGYEFYLRVFNSISHSFAALTNSGLEIATHWSPMRPKIERWRLAFSPMTKENHDTTFVFKSSY